MYTLHNSSNSSMMRGEKRRGREERGGEEDERELSVISKQDDGQLLLNE